jgi:hypothetical protein
MTSLLHPAISRCAPSRENLRRDGDGQRGNRADVPGDLPGRGQRIRSSKPFHNLTTIFDRTSKNPPGHKSGAASFRPLPKAEAALS